MDEWSQIKLNEAQAFEFDIGTKNRYSSVWLFTELHQDRTLSSAY